MRLLEAEGFAPAREVDIFDAGPILECATAAIRSVRDARALRVGRVGRPRPAPARTAIVAIPEPARFRAVRCRVAGDGDGGA